MEYQKTGRNIEVPYEEMYNYVIEKLDEYDRLAEATQVEPPNSPYKNTVIYNTQDGKMVQIPIEIQAKATQDYLKNKYGNDLIEEIPVQEDGNHSNFRPPVTQHTHTKVNSSGWSIWWLVLIIVIAVVAYFYWFKPRL